MGQKMNKPMQDAEGNYINAKSGKPLTKKQIKEYEHTVRLAEEKMRKQQGAAPSAAASSSNINGTSHFNRNFSPQNDGTTSSLGANINGGNIVPTNFSEDTTVSSQNVNCVSGELLRRIDTGSSDAGGAIAVPINWNDAFNQDAPPGVGNPVLQTQVAESAPTEEKPQEQPKPEEKRAQKGKKEIIEKMDELSPHLNDIIPTLTHEDIEQMHAESPDSEEEECDDAACLADGYRDLEAAQELVHKELGNDEKIRDFPKFDPSKVQIPEENRLSMDMSTSVPITSSLANNTKAEAATSSQNLGEYSGYSSSSTTPANIFVDTLDRKKIFKKVEEEAKKQGDMSPPKISEMLKFKLGVNNIISGTMPPSMRRKIKEEEEATRRRKNGDRS